MLTVQSLPFRGFRFYFKGSHMSAFTVAVTGDKGLDTYTRYIPGYVSESDDDFSAEVSFDLRVPSGAALHSFALNTLLKADNVKAINCAVEPSTMPQSLKFLESYQWNGNDVIRISRAVPLKFPETHRLRSLKIRALPPRPHMLIVHDSTSLWRTSVLAADRVANFFATRRRPRGDAPTVLVVLEDGIPQLRVDRARRAFLRSRQSPVWTVLMQHAQEVAILCSLTSLRHAGAGISRRLSWEQGVEDILGDLEHFQPLQALAQFRHLFIHAGFVGVIHIENDTQTNPSRTASAVFAPAARKGIFCDETKDGQIQCQTSVLAACLVRLVKSCMSRSASVRRMDVADALKCGLTANMRLFDLGYRCPSTLIDAGDNAGKEFLQGYFRPRGQGGKAIEDVATIVTSPYDRTVAELRIPRDRMFGTVTLPDIPFDPLKAKPWQILRSQIRKQKMSRINIGIAICKFGHQEVLNRPLDGSVAGAGTWKVTAESVIDVLKQPECVLSANEPLDEEPLKPNIRVALPHPTNHRPPQPEAHSLFTPTFEAANLVAIERNEIESVRSIHNLIEWYVRSKGQSVPARRPISVAVFGAPGSGKSFAIKQMARSINEGIRDDAGRLEILECNVAQFRSVEDLGIAINRIASLNNERKIPLVFFDEFDCPFQARPLGWLQYFLAPMQDGTFYGASQTITFGRAVFVFAGGVARTLFDFDPFARSSGRNVNQKDEELTPAQRFFKEQKGPDFVSRLRGHINILSLNPDDTAPKDEDGKPLKPILRRALTLRGQILDAQRYVVRDGCKVANVDNDVLYAFLTVEEYRHGTRSMEAILNMCTPIDGVIEKASLPSHTQLNMHVDADEFMARVLRGRFRSFLGTRARRTTASATVPGRKKPRRSKAVAGPGKRAEQLWKKSRGKKGGGKKRGGKKADRKTPVKL
jgi:hypothetical protein